MQADFLDHYSRLESPVHRLPAAVKLAGALALVVGVLLVSPLRPIGLAFMALPVLAIAAVSCIPWWFLVRRLLLLEPFVLGVAVLALFQRGGWYLFLVLIGKCTLCLLTMLLLANTTPFAELLRVLRAVHVPALLVTTLSLMYRYLSVLVDETQRMRRARMSRTFTAQRTRAWRTMATVLTQLFIRTTERAERIYAAMCARGWR
jgi:cobalt/nickel transport system permease protein